MKHKELAKSECDIENEKKRLKERNDQLRLRIENARRLKSQTFRSESTSTISSTVDDENASCPSSPHYLEYSPSTKQSPVYSYDLYNDGLLPLAPLLHPRPSVYPFFDVKTPPCINNYVLFPIEIGLRN
uniref:BZIP domain-containing protein n=1 Tax=Syphacia muris TaxID=451379 RepID=A0A0N5AVU3_9BILA